MSIEMIEIEEFNQGTQIKVIGVGGGGGNAVGHMSTPSCSAKPASSEAMTARLRLSGSAL